MKTKILSLLMVLCLLVTSVPFVAVAATSGTLSSGSVQYTLSNNTLTLSGSGSVSISGDSPWEAEKATITNIVINDGITAIAAGAFSDLTALNTVDMAKTVETVEAGAFPASAFTMKGWLNHASGKYAEANSNVSLKLKELRILSFGNSHTDDYRQYFSNIFTDLNNAGIQTEFTFEYVTKGARRMYSTTATAGSHYDGAKTTTDEKYQAYRAAFAKTWDLVIIQDYHESTYSGATFADSVAKTVEWLHQDAAGAKIAWYADLVEQQDRVKDAAAYYNRSVAAMTAVGELTENAPDFIIPASTIYQNALSSYFGTTLNPNDTFTGYKETFYGILPILERDQAHVSYELGRQLMGTAVMYFVYRQFQEELLYNTAVDYFSAIQTVPHIESASSGQKGEFLPEHWDILEEAITNAYNQPLAHTASQYTTDPFNALYAQVKSVIAEAGAADQLPATITQATLEAHFKSETVLKKLAAIEKLNITAENVSISFTSETDWEVEVDCHYGYSYPMVSASNSLVASGKLPSIQGDNTSTFWYIFLNDDGKTHTVRIENPSYTDQTPDYESNANATEENPVFTSLPWHASPYKDTVTTIIVDASISYIGKYFFCTNYATAVTDIYIQHPSVGLHTNTFFDSGTSTPVHTVHLYSGVDISGLAPNKLAYYSFSYYEAEEYIETYNALWTVDENDVSAVLAKGSAILNASNAMEALPTVAKTQLSADTLPNSTVTYSAKLAALQATLAANTDASGGDVNGDGLVNLLDVMITLRRLAGKDYNGAMEPREMFLNGDNVADMADAVLMLRRTAGWDVVTYAAPTDVTILYNSETFTYYYE